MTFCITDGIFHKADSPPSSSMQSTPFEVADDAAEIIIPDGVTSIWRSALSSRTSLRKVHLPSSVTYIGRMAFANCIALEEINIPDSVTAIGNNAFDSCISLQSITLPDSITSIAEYTFLNCAALRSISIPNSVRSIGTWAFCFCFTLEEITIPESVVSIGRNILHGCRELRCISLSKHHLSLDWLRVMLPGIPSIRCIVPIDEIPAALRLKACVGFAESEAAYSEELRKGYIEYLRFCAKTQCEAVLDSPALLNLLCRERLIDASCFDELLEEVLRRENTALTAVLLEYRHTHLSSAADSFSDDLSLD